MFVVGSTKMTLILLLIQIEESYLKNHVLIRR